jgi:hypothetical protein
MNGQLLRKTSAPWRWFNQFLLMYFVLKYGAGEGWRRSVRPII